MGNQISDLQDDHLWLLGKESPLFCAQAQCHITNGLPFQRGAKGWEAGWEDCSGWQTNLLFVRIPHWSFTENLKHEVWRTSESSLLPPSPSRLHRYCFGRSQICLGESDSKVLPKKANLSPWLPCVLHSALLRNCKCLEKQNFQLQEAVPVPLLAVVFHKWGWKSFKASKWSVPLLRSPHFLNCSLIVQAGHNLTGYKEISKLVKEMWNCRYFPTYMTFPS